MTWTAMAAPRAACTALTCLASTVALGQSVAAEQVVGGDPYSLQGHFGVARGAAAHRVCDPSHPDTGRVGLDHDGGGSLAVASEDDEQVGVVGGGYPDLVTVDDQGVALAADGGADGRQVAVAPSSRSSGSGIRPSRFQPPARSPTRAATEAAASANSSLTGGEFRVVHVDEGDRDAVADRQRRDARAHDAGAEDDEVVVWLLYIGRLLALGSGWCRAGQSPASRPDRPDSAARVSP
ncbi:hypothetical protein SMF913_12110 [Streptomyces malaysiensis]|uniref:Uncharacterized protein n=1 Tax=Streptomyces malaysiensis TaxID=92644 RepID=A0A2J7Z733_STRMQ|nr:hypothetical protein SMF913_12110 [Streptomyces malaysiensis]